MSTRQADKAEKKSPTDVSELPFDQVFGALEQRVEGMASRMKDVVSENAHLKSALAEATAGRERAVKELDDLRKTSEAHGAAAEKLSRLESEREEVRGRIERLLGTLAEAEAAPAEG